MNKPMSDEQVRARFDLTKPHHFLALGFGAGLMRPAPGTWGTLVAVPIFLLLSAMATPMVYIGVTLLISVVGIWICGRCAQDIGVHDHGAIVWDEIAGFLVTMTLVEATWLNILLGFGLFRFFDIVKPWPIGYVDRKVQGGFGIMIDDIIAGLFSLIVLHLVLTLI
ncbi:MAG: phosphatidylglycerophosphatase A [Alteromonadaceae bacterium]|jgi:phosphatidylglycerophosphatase A